MNNTKLKKLKSKLKKLKKAIDAASPGPWTEDDGNIFSKPLSDIRHKNVMDRLQKKNVPDLDQIHEEEGYSAPLGWIAGTEQAQPKFEEDTQLIVLMRNILPELIDFVEENLK